MSNVLKDHLEVVERVIIAKSKIAANTGHPVHKGTLREAFIKEFLVEHLSERVGIGQGEIIDAKSQTGDRRNQQDIVLYRKDYPKITFGGGIAGFLAESVVATIEVKSLLTKPELDHVIPIAHNVKKLERNLKKGWEIMYRPNTSILSFIVAYDCPTNLETVASWLTPLHQKHGIPLPSMIGSALQRVEVPSPSLDGIFILGKGYILFDNTHLRFEEDAQLHAHVPNGKWISGGRPDIGLFLLFMLLTDAISDLSITRLDPNPYIPPLGPHMIYLTP